MYHFYEAEPSSEAVTFPRNIRMTNQQTQTVRYECSKCDSIFTSRIYLHQHEATAHNRLFHCPFCAALFSNKADFRIHVSAHSEKRYLPCSFCKKVFHEVDKYTAHVKMHREPFTYSCDKCPAIFSQLSSLRVHSSDHLRKKFVHMIPTISKHIAGSCKKLSKKNSKNHTSTDVMEVNETSVACASVASQTSDATSLVVSAQVASTSPISHHTLAPKARISRASGRNNEVTSSGEKYPPSCKLTPSLHKRGPPRKQKSVVEEISVASSQTVLASLPLTSSSSGNENAVNLTASGEYSFPGLKQKENSRKRGRPRKQKPVVEKTSVPSSQTVLELLPLTTSSSDNENEMNLAPAEEYSPPGLKQKENSRKYGQPRKKKLVVGKTSVASSKTVLELLPLTSSSSNNENEMNLAPAEEYSPPGLKQKEKSRKYRQPRKRKSVVEKTSVASSQAVLELLPLTSSSSNNGNEMNLAPAEEYPPPGLKQKENSRKCGQPCKKKSVIEKTSVISSQTVLTSLPLTTSSSENENEMNLVPTREYSLPGLKQKENSQKHGRIRMQKPVVEKTVVASSQTITASVSPTRSSLGNDDEMNLFTVGNKSLLSFKQKDNSHQRGCPPKQKLVQAVTVSAPSTSTSSVNDSDTASAESPYSSTNIFKQIPPKCNCPRKLNQEEKASNASAQGTALSRNDEIINVKINDSNKMENILNKEKVSNPNDGNAGVSAETNYNFRRRSELYNFYLTSIIWPKKKSLSCKRRRSTSVFYKCSFCQRVFPNYSVLSKHKQIHAENRGFRCDKCGGVFGGQGNLVAHQRHSHGTLT